MNVMVPWIERIGPRGARYRTGQADGTTTCLLRSSAARFGTVERLGAGFTMWRVIRLGILLAAVLAAYGWWSGHDRAPASPVAVGVPDPGGGAGHAVRDPALLPPAAIDTLRAIERGGPFPYDRDGVVFQNRERRLPDRPRGYYHEYTVRTPGASDRGARRIITGGDPPEVYYYTDDHYRSFRRMEPQK
jgi:guanyl-specific ribonuclease Sa